MTNIHAKYLSELLNVSPKLLVAIWGEPTNDSYSTTEVDKTLATLAFGFKRPLTIEGLIARRVILIKTQEAAHLLGIHKRSLPQRFYSKSPLPFVRFSKKELRFDKRFIEAQLEAARNAFTLREVGEILGVSDWWVGQLVNRGVLTPATMQPYGKKISEAEIVRFLQKRLYSTIKPLAWIKGMRDGSIVLLARQQAKEQLDVDDEELDHLLLSGKLEYLRIVERGWHLITQASIEAYKSSA